MTHSTRYHFEHRLLPWRFFEQPDRFWKDLSEGAGTLLQLLQACYLLEGAESPYVAEQFEVSVTETPEGHLSARLSFPAPEDITDCYFAYVFRDKQSGYSRYFTVEKSLGDKPVLGEWELGQHHNHGTFSLDDDKLRTICYNKFLQRLSS